MRESVKKLGLIGVGLWAMTEDKIDELVKDLVDKGDISKEEGKKVIQDMLEESKKQRIDLEKKISEKIQESVSKAEVFTRKDKHDLEARIKALEEELEKLRNKEKMFFK
jgi:polyhydroxyalkanoate synthesis regulator phasin